MTRCARTRSCDGHTASHAVARLLLWWLLIAAPCGCAAIPPAPIERSHWRAQRVRLQPGALVRLRQAAAETLWIERYSDGGRGGETDWRERLEVLHVAEGKAAESDDPDREAASSLLALLPCPHRAGPDDTIVVPAPGLASVTLGLRWPATASADIVLRVLRPQREPLSARIVRAAGAPAGPGNGDNDPAPLSEDPASWPWALLEHAALTPTTTAVCTDVLEAVQRLAAQRHAFEQLDRLPPSERREGTVALRGAVRMPLLGPDGRESSVYRSEPGAGARFEIEGPVLLRVEALAWPEPGQPPGSAQRFTILLELDGHRWTRLPFVSAAPSRGPPAAGGRFGEAHLVLPPGRHRVRLVGARPLLLRCLVAGPRAALIDGPWPDAVARTLLARAREQLESASSLPAALAAYLRWCVERAAGRCAEAERAVETACRRLEDGAIAPSLRLAIALAAAEAAGRRGDPAAAERWLARADRLTGEVPIRGARHAVALVRAESLALLGQLDAASDLFLELASRTEPAAERWGQAARWWQVRDHTPGDQPVALRALERAARLEPTRPLWRAHRDRLRSVAVRRMRLPPARRQPHRPRTQWLPRAEAAAQQRPLGREEALALRGGEPLHFVATGNRRIVVEIPAESEALPDTAVRPVRLRLDDEPVRTVLRLGGEPLALAVVVGPGPHRLVVDGPGVGSARARLSGSIIPEGGLRLQRVVFDTVATDRDQALRYVLPRARLERRVHLTLGVELLRPGAQATVHVQPDGGVATRVHLLGPTESDPARVAASHLRLVLPVSARVETLRLWAETSGGLRLGAQLEFEQRRPAPPVSVTAAGSGDAAHAARGARATRQGSPWPAIARLRDLWFATPAETTPGEALVLLEQASRRLRAMPPEASSRTGWELLRGWCLLHLGQPHLASAALARAERRAAPGSAPWLQVLSALAEAQRTAGLTARADRSLARLVSARPTDAHLRRRWAELALERGAALTALERLEPLRGVAQHVTTTAWLRLQARVMAGLAVSGSELRDVFAGSLSEPPPRPLLAAALATGDRQVLERVATAAARSAPRSVVAALAHALSVWRQRRENTGGGPAQRVRTAIALALLDSAWPLRSERPQWSPLPPHAVGSPRVDRIVSVSTGRSMLYHDLSGAGLTAEIEGPTLVKIALRADVAPATATRSAVVRTALTPLGVTQAAIVSTVRLDGRLGSLDLRFPQRPELRPGLRRELLLPVGPGHWRLQVRAEAGAAHGRLRVASPGPLALLSAPNSLTGPRAARQRAVALLSLIASEERPDPVLLALARTLAGRSLASDRALLATALRHGLFGFLDRRERAFLWFALGSPTRCVQTLLEGDRAGEDPLGFAALCSLWPVTEPQLSDELARRAARALARAADAVAHAEPAPRLRAARMALDLWRRQVVPQARWATRAASWLDRLPARARPPSTAALRRRLEHAIVRSTLRDADAPAGLVALRYRERPLGTAGRIAAALHPSDDDPSAAASLLVTGGSTTELSLAPAITARVRLEASAQQLAPPEPSGGATVALAWALDDARPNTATIPLEPARSEISVGSIPPGSHVLRFALVQPGVGRSVRLTPHSDRPVGAGPADVRASAVRERARWIPVLSPLHVPAAVAAGGAPVRYVVRGPLQLTLVLRAATPHAPTASASVLLRGPGGPRTIGLPLPTAPDPDCTRAGAVLGAERTLTLPLVRPGVYRIEVSASGAGAPVLVEAIAGVDRSPSDPGQPAGPGLAPLQAAGGWADRSLDRLGARSPLSTRRPAPPRPRAEQAGTVEVTIRGWAQDRRAAVNDRATEAYLESSASIGARVEPHAWWWEAGARIRLLRRARPVFGASLRTDGSLAGGRLRWGARVRTAFEDVGEHLAWSVHGRVRLRHRLPLDERTFALVSNLQLAASEQSLRSFGSIDPERVSFEVFSPYYETHDRWLQGRLELRARPWLDAWGFVSGEARTNRRLAPWDLDRVSVRGGMRAITANWGWGWDVEQLWRLRDDDRAAVDSELRLTVRCDTILWSGPRTGWVLGARLRYVADTGEAGIGFELGWRGSGRRVLRDDRPGRWSFSGRRSAFYRWDRSADIGS